MPSMRRLTQLLRHPRSVIRYPGAMLRYRRFASGHPELAAVIDGVRRRRLTYLRPPNLQDLAQLVLQVERDSTPGAIIEAGTALGGSMIVLATAKSRSRELLAYDTFGMIPPPSSRDGDDVHQRYQDIVAGKASGIGGDEYYGYRDDLREDVLAAARSFDLDPEHDHIRLVQGRFEDTMVVDFPVSVAHLDCDWYSSVKVCLEAIDPHLVSGGRFVIDDYEHWSGCRQAVDEFLAERGRDYATEWRSRLHLIRR